MRIDHLVDAWCREYPFLATAQFAKLGVNKRKESQADPFPLKEYAKVFVLRMDVAYCDSRPVFSRRPSDKTHPGAFVFCGGTTGSEMITKLAEEEQVGPALRRLRDGSLLHQVKYCVRVTEHIFASDKKRQLRTGDLYVTIFLPPKAGKEKGFEWLVEQLDEANRRIEEAEAQEAVDLVSQVIAAAD